MNTKKKKKNRREGAGKERNAGYTYTGSAKMPSGLTKNRKKNRANGVTNGTDKAPDAARASARAGSSHEATQCISIVGDSIGSTWLRLTGAQNSSVVGRVIAVSVDNVGGFFFSFLF